MSIDRNERIPCPQCGRYRSRRNLARHLKSCDSKPELSTEERFWQRVEKSGRGGCWNWTGSVASNNGYGRIRVEGVTWRAHRLAWTLLVGDIPDEMVIDHICRNRRCVNPDHLRVVTAYVNSTENTVGNATKTHCKHGHEFTEANTYVYDKGRACKACMRIRNARRNSEVRGTQRPKVPCPHCDKQISKPGISSHIRRMHSEVSRVD